MMVIGAAIGGVTNYIAIKMLFRPYNPIYIGEWRLPFTPGLIPRRRKELAVQLGNIVVNHLLTPESIEKKLLNEGFQNEMIAMVRKESERLFSSEETLQEWLQKFGFEQSEEKIKKKMNDYIKNMYVEWMDNNQEQTIMQVMPENIIKAIENKIPNFSSYLLQKIADYFSSVEGKMKIERMIYDFIQSKGGMFANMLQMFLGNTNITEKVQKELIQFLESSGMEQLLTTLLKKEWKNLLMLEVKEIEKTFEREKIVYNLQNIMQKLVKVENIFHEPMTDLLAPAKPHINEKFIPFAVNQLGKWISPKIKIIMDKLHISEIVTNEVDSFSVQRLEEMVLMIAKRELEMITYLGAILGGIIGFFQGIIATIL